MSSHAPAPDRPVPGGSWDRRGTWTGLDQSSVMGVELLAAVLLWTFVGHLVDRWLGTDPWFLAIGALGGFAAGLYLIVVRARRLELADAARRREASGA